MHHRDKNGKYEDRRASNTYTMGIPEKERKAIFEEMIVDNFSELPQR